MFSFIKNKLNEIIKNLTTEINIDFVSNESYKVLIEGHELWYCTLNKGFISTQPRDPLLVASMYIQHEYQRITSYVLWTEPDVMDRIYKVLESGKSGRIVLPMGFARHIININFLKEKI